VDSKLQLAVIGCGRISRAHLDGIQALPDRIQFERGGLLPAVIARLEAMGHTVAERSGYSGQVAGIMRTPDGWVGVADPRSGGGSVGY